MDLILIYWFTEISALVHTRSWFCFKSKRCACTSIAKYVANDPAVWKFKAYMSWERNEHWDLKPSILPKRKVRSWWKTFHMQKIWTFLLKFPMQTTLSVMVYLLVNIWFYPGHIMKSMENTHFASKWICALIFRSNKEDAKSPSQCLLGVFVLTAFLHFISFCVLPFYTVVAS